MSSKSRNRWIVVVVSFIIGASAGFLYAFFVPVSFASLDIMTTDDLVPTFGFEQASVTLDGETVALTSDCQQLSFDVTADQAFSIGLALEEQTHSRPLTHDLVHDVFNHYDIHVIAAQIDESVDGIYTAKLYLSRGNEALKIDARPSDAIGLGLRSNVPIMVKTDILKNFGETVC